MAGKNFLYLWLGDKSPQLFGQDVMVNFATDMQIYGSIS